MSARDDILARIRAAVAGGEASADDAAGARPDREAAAYRVSGAKGREERLALFVARVEEYGVRIQRCAAAEVGATLLRILRSRRAAGVVAPPGLAPEWRPDGVEWLDDERESLAVERLAASDGVVSGCAVAIAETGTVVLDGGPGQGRRALTLVPDYHLCVVAADQVVETVPEAIRRLEPAARAGRPITFVSGPSATSDIELSRVAGVHGPRTLDIVLVD